MKNWGYLSVTSVALLTLTACVNSNPTPQIYSSSDLRAPSYQPAQTNVSVPQSVNQPMNINPVPTNVQVVSQQPAVQTMTVSPYATQPVSTMQQIQPVYNTQPVQQNISVQPMQQVQPAQQVASVSATPTVNQSVNGIPQITIPAHSIIAPDTPIQPHLVVPVASQQAPTMYQSNSTTPKFKSVAEKAKERKEAAEQVYPAWAASNFTPPVPNKTTEAVVYFKNPNRNETVQCSAVDIMCIASYQQQGYKQVQSTTTTTTTSVVPSAPVIIQSQQPAPVYQNVEWDMNSIPRW
ncbi:MAG: hypothetical protein IJY58_04170 [Alphaproteobacteria bacterium]|nr:hypothetical protein [Alphaproteobacteria bacterium]